MERRSTRQLSLALPLWGGKRAGAGRKPIGKKSGVSHRQRDRMTKETPVHVTLRMEKHVWNLRTRRCFRAIETALAVGCDRFGMRVVHFSVQGNHVHLLVETARRASLGKGMQGLCVRIARRLNQVMGRKGRVFADRYHGRVLRTPREVRNALAYVLLNARRHTLQRGKLLMPHWMDPYSSATCFDGWQPNCSRRIWMMATKLPVVSARSWLLTKGWRRHGLLGTVEA